MKNTYETLPDILNMKQACELLNCHPNTLRNWEKAGIITPIRIGSRGDRRYHKTEIQDLINTNKK